jgi:hypothetical protein
VKRRNKLVIGRYFPLIDCRADIDGFADCFTFVGFETEGLAANVSFGRLLGTVDCRGAEAPIATAGKPYTLSISLGFVWPANPSDCPSKAGG